MQCKRQASVRSHKNKRDQKNSMPRSMASASYAKSLSTQERKGSARLPFSVGMLRNACRAYSPSLGSKHYIQTHPSAGMQGPCGLHYLLQAWRLQVELEERAYGLCHAPELINAFCGCIVRCCWQREGSHSTAVQCARHHCEG